MNEWLNGWMDGWMAERMNERTNKRTNKRTNEQTNEQMNERTDEQKSPCVLQDFFSFGAAALPPSNLNHKLLKQGTGTTDHLLSLGCYFLSISCLIFFHDTK